MAQILLLDDDKNTLRSLERVLTRIPSYKISSFISATEALDSIERGKRYDVVISDYRMPQMDGITFLKRFKKLLPTAARIVHTGFTDRASLICAINEVQAHRYLEKPCDPETLKAILAQVVAEQGQQGALEELQARLREQEQTIHQQQTLIMQLQAAT